MNITIIYLFLFFLLSCNSNSNEIPKKSSKLKIIKTIVLEENHNAILTTVANISTDKNESKFLLSDDLGRNLILYDSSGKIIKYFYFGYNFSDSLANKSTPYDYPKYEYITTTEIMNVLKNSKEKLSQEFFTQYLNNEIKNGIFKNDSIILIQLYIRSIKKEKDSLFNPRNIRIGNTSNVIQYNINNDAKQLISFESIAGISFVQSYFILYNYLKKKYIVSCTNTIPLREGRWDSLSVLSQYSIDGKFEKVLFNLPQEYVDTKLGYSLYYPKCAMNNSGDIFCVMPICQKIYNISDNTTIKLKNLPNNNEEYIDMIKNNSLNANEIMDNQDNYYFLPNYINGIYINNKSNYLVWIINYNMIENKIQVDEIKQHIIQEYSNEGNLIRYFTIKHKNENGLVNFIKYLPYSDEILVCRKSSTKGWILEFYREIQ